MENTDFYKSFTKKAELEQEKKDRWQKAELASGVSGLVNILSGWLAAPLAKKLLRPMLEGKEYFKSTIESVGTGKGKYLKKEPFAGLNLLNIGSVEDNYYKKDLKDFNKLVKQVTPYIKKQKLENVRFKTQAFSGLGADYYHPLKHMVAPSTKDKYITLHELGHAADFRGSIPKVVATKIPGVLSGLLVAPALLQGDVIKEKIPGTIDDKVVDFINDHPVMSALSGYGIGTLYPEFKASGSALKYLLKHEGKEEFKKGLKVLAPAYGTYLLGGVPIAASAYAMKKIMDKRRKRSADKAELNKAAGLNDKQKALLTGSLIGASIGLPTAYFLNTTGGRALLEDDIENPYRSFIDKKIKQTALDNPKSTTALVTLGVAGLAGLGATLAEKLKKGL